jgi:hypothetical protein
MPKPSWENLDDFLQLDSAGGFANTATIDLQDGSTITVRGIFDDPYLNAQLGEYDHDTSAPRFLCKAADVTAVRRQDELTIDGTTYDVLTAPQDDGTGMATIKLAPR